MYFKRIKDLRIDNDKTQKQIAEFLNCNRQVYARYENGTREIPISMLIKLALYYNQSIDYIVGISDNKNNNNEIGITQENLDTVELEIDT